LISRSPRGLKINRRKAAKGGIVPHARASPVGEAIQANPKLIAQSQLHAAAAVCMTTGKGNCSEGNSVGAGAPPSKARLSSQTSSVESTREAVNAGSCKRGAHGMSNGGGRCRAQKVRGRTSSRRHDDSSQGKVTWCVAYRAPKGFGTTGGAHRGGFRR